jgi:tetratricopeptide (TPR) repeat protein
MRYRRTVCAVVAMGVILCGCAPSQWIARGTTRMIQGGLTAYEAEPDLELVAQALPAQIKLLETLLASDPGNPELLVLLAQHYGLYAFGFVDLRYEKHLFSSGRSAGGADALSEGEDLRDRLNRYYLRGVEYALKALEATAPDCRHHLRQPDSRQRFLSELEPQAVPPLFWYAFNLAGYIHRNLDSVPAMARAEEAAEALDRITQLRPGYGHGLAHLALIVYFGGRSPQTGGNAELAEKHYQALRRLAGDSFRLAPLFYARTVSVQRQDVDGFRQLLGPLTDTVVEGDPLALYNALARERARYYLSLTDDLFI